MTDQQALARPFEGRRGHRVPNGPRVVTVYVVETGEALEVKPISAREGVAAGVWSYTPPEPSEAPAETQPDAGSKKKGKTA